MNRQSIHQQIDSLLKIIRDQHEQLKNHSSSIPQVEIDFMVQNLRQLYEAALMLNHTNALSSLDEVKAAVTQKILAEKRAVEMKRNDDPPKEQKEIPVMAQPQPESSHHSMNEVIASVGAVEPPVEATKSKPSRKQPHDINTGFEDKPTVGGRFGSGESLHRKIASQTSSKTIADKLHRNPIKDLKAAIGINEKFLFINKLFQGDLQSYSAAVDKINSTADLSAAKQIAADLAGQMNWDDDNEHVKNFMELVERRFS
jgi:hypothetical protein